MLIQIVRELHEVDRRSARFAQQQRLLLNARGKLARSQTPELALEVVSNTESKLLDEVLEWYFHAETAERFVELREPAGLTPRASSRTRLQQRNWPVLCLAKLE